VTIQSIKGSGHPLRRVIRRFDAFQRRRLGVYEYCGAADCILRISVERTSDAVLLGDVSVAPGEQVVVLHFWNEHLVPMPARGPDIAYALAAHRVFVGSLRALARHLLDDPALADVRAVGGVIVLLSPHDHPAGLRLMERLGFAVRPHPQPLGRFGEFWENFYTWWVMWTYNPGSLAGRRLIRLERSEIRIQVEDFLRRYG
jgi:hypothetical protein